MLNLRHFWVNVCGKKPKPLIPVTYTPCLSHCDSEFLFPLIKHFEKSQFITNTAVTFRGELLLQVMIFLKSWLCMLSLILLFWGVVYFKSAVASSNLLSHYYWQPIPLESLNKQPNPWPMLHQGRTVICYHEFAGWTLSFQRSKAWCKMHLLLPPAWCFDRICCSYETSIYSNVILILWTVLKSFWYIVKSNGAWKKVLVSTIRFSIYCLSQVCYMISLSFTVLQRPENSLQ